NVAYLNPGPFSSAKENGEQQYRAFIDSAFADINTKGVKDLVIDLRNNTGGDNSYSDYLIAYFADKPFRWYSKFSLKTSEVLKEQTKRNTPEEKRGDYAKAILGHEDGEVFDYTFPEQKPVEEARRFKGEVYVLVNRHTYSMAAVSAALIQDYNFAKIVGEETGDVPTLYASQFSFTLPNTGIVVKAAKGYMVRPSGDERLIGVVPDIKVRDHLLDEKDEILDYTLDKVISPTTNKH
ncbi:MAG: peptidase S41, partial [Pontibacter sp.]|nr:peptidase S41 [Pontibacter sp.]